MNADTYLKFKDNRIVDQAANTANCGYFAAKFLIDRFRNKPFPEATGYDNHVKAEKDIEAWKQKQNIQPYKYVESFSGDGIVDVAKEAIERVKGFFTGRTKPPPAIRALVQKNGTDTIASLSVVRSPVSSVITKVLNIVSGGSLEANRRKFYYDDLYHLGLLVQLSSGRQFVLERNQTVQVNPARSFEASMPVDIAGKDIMLGHFLEAGEKLAKYPFWQYNPTQSNCQMFVTDLLKGSHLMNPSLNKFINQDAEGLLKDSPLAKKIAAGLSDFGHRLDILFTGAGRGSAPLPPEKK